MANETLVQLQEEVLQHKKDNRILKSEVGRLREDLLRARTMQKRLIASYETVIKEWKIAYRDLIQNGWRIVFVKVYNKFKEV